jgi:hypothetical protein
MDRYSLAQKAQHLGGPRHIELDQDGKATLVCANGEIFLGWTKNRPRYSKYTTGVNDFILDDPRENVTSLGAYLRVPVVKRGLDKRIGGR